MRRGYISPEFRYDAVPGTFNMRESGAMYGSKMMDIEDTLRLDNSNVIYYQGGSGEQVSLAIERSNPAVLYNTLEDKRANHTIELDPAQNQQQLDSATRWIVSVDLGRVLSNYLFATLKAARTFEGVRNEGTLYNSVDTAVRDYVAKNLVGRYVLSGFDFWIGYVPLSTQGSLRYRNVFSEAAREGQLTTRVQTSYNYDKTAVRVSFAQEMPSSTHRFDYYFAMSYARL